MFLNIILDSFKLLASTIVIEQKYQKLFIFTDFIRKKFKFFDYSAQFVDLAHNFFIIRRRRKKWFFTSLLKNLIIGNFNLASNGIETSNAHIRSSIFLYFLYLTLIFPNVSFFLTFSPVLNFTKINKDDI